MSSPPADAPPRTFERLELPDTSRELFWMRALVALLLVGGAAGVFAWRRTRAASADLFRTAAVERKTIARGVTATGHLDAKERIEVPAPVSSRLLEILVVVGDEVTEGQVLARLDSRPSTLQVGTASAAVTAASSRLGSAGVAAEAARSELERVQQLVARGLASEAEIAGARVRLEQAEAMVRAARADRSMASSNLESARLGEGAMELRAPATGVVLRAPRDVGGLVGPEKGALFVIGVGLEELVVEASIGEADVALLRAGQGAWFEVPAFVGRQFTATVTRVEIEGTVADGAVSYGAYFRAPNPDRTLYPGMTAILHVEVARAPDALVVNEAALRFEPEGAEPAPPRTRVWRRVGPSRLEPVAVTTGISDGTFTEVHPASPSALRVGAPLVIGMQVMDDETRATVSLGSGRSRGER